MELVARNALCSRDLMLFPMQIIIVSANCIISWLDSELFILFTYIRNNNGPRFDPWGTPVLIVLVAEEYLCIA